MYVDLGPEIHRAATILKRRYRDDPRIPEGSRITIPMAVSFFFMDHDPALVEKALRAVSIESEGVASDE